MSGVFRFLAEEFELQSMDKECNERGCKKTPMKKIVVFESEGDGSGRREIASLFFCNEHYRGFLEKSLEGLESGGKSLGKRVYEIGYLTF